MRNTKGWKKGKQWFSSCRLVITAQEECDLIRCHWKLDCASQTVPQTFCIQFQSLEQDKPLPEPEWGTEIQRCLGTGFLLVSLIFLVLDSTKTGEWPCRGEWCYHYLWGFYYHQCCHRNKTFHFYDVYFNLYSQILCVNEVLNIMT